MNRENQHNQRIYVDGETLRRAKRLAWEGHMTLSGVVAASVREVVAGRLAPPEPPQMWGVKQRGTLTIHPDNWLVAKGDVADPYATLASRATLASLLVYAFSEKRLYVTYEVRHAA